MLTPIKAPAFFMKWTSLLLALNKKDYDSGSRLLKSIYRLFGSAEPSMLVPANVNLIGGLVFFQTNEPELAEKSIATSYAQISNGDWIKNKDEQTYMMTYIKETAIELYKFIPFRTDRVKMMAGIDIDGEYEIRNIRQDIVRMFPVRERKI